MSKNQLKISVVFITLFLAANIAAKAIGSLQSPNPALKGFTEGCENKPQPCWYGIVPGVTTWEAAESILVNMDYRPYYLWWGSLVRASYWASANHMYLVDFEAYPTSNFNNVETIQLLPNCRFEEWILHPRFGYYVIDTVGIMRRSVKSLGARTALSTTDAICEHLWAELEAKWSSEDAYS